MAVFLADSISSLHDARVLLVDLDLQGSASRAILPEATLAEAFKQGRSLTRLLEQAVDGSLDEELRWPRLSRGRCRGCGGEAPFRSARSAS